MTRKTWRRVKDARIVVSLAFLALSISLFLDPWFLLPREVPKYVTSIQFLPSLTKAITVGGAFAIAGLSIVVVATLLMGRVYCSTICPLGVLQDIMFRFARKLNKRKRFKYFKPPFWLHYSVLTAAVLAVLVGGGMIMGDLLEPFSNFGRMLVSIGLPAVVFANNTVADLFTHFSVYSIPNIPMHAVDTGSLVFTIIFFGAITYLSMTEGRLFCNSFCPAGAILGLISRASFLRLEISTDLCNKCGACDKVCKSQCIDSDSGKIDFSACVGCFNCLRSCPKDNGIKYVRKWKPATNKYPATLEARRDFIRTLAVPAAALLVAPGVAIGGGEMLSRPRPITPPGSVSLRRFTEICTACQMCVSSCPTGVLQPSFLEYGLTGMQQPMMNYAVNYCNYDCVICGEVCPTGAIKELSLPIKKLTQIGKSNFHKDDCVVVSKKQDCAACSEHCPTKAVHTVPYESGLLLPEIDNDLCIGCGACEHACPVIPRKAITVTANEVHSFAKKPASQPAPAPRQSTLQEFPF